MSRSRKRPASQTPLCPPSWCHGRPAERGTRARRHLRWRFGACLKASHRAACAVGATLACGLRSCVARCSAQLARCRAATGRSRAGCPMRRDPSAMPRVKRGTDATDCQFAHAQDDGAVAPSPASASNHAELSASSVHEAAAASPALPTASAPAPTSAPVPAAKPRGFSPNVPVSAVQSAKSAALVRRLSLEVLLRCIGLSAKPDAACMSRSVLCRSRTSRWTARLAFWRLLRPLPRRQQVAGAYRRRRVAGVHPWLLMRRPRTTKLWPAGPTWQAAPHHRRRVPCVIRANVAVSVADLHIDLFLPWLQLPPPSYADSVYFDRTEITPQDDSGGSGAVAADDGSLAGSLTVAVTSPEKRADSSSALGRLAGKKYVAFAVAYRAEGLPAFAAAPAGAPRRRFRDFVGLAARLVRHHCCFRGSLLALTLDARALCAGREPPRLLHPTTPRKEAGRAAGRQVRYWVRCSEPSNLCLTVHALCTLARSSSRSAATRWTSGCASTHPSLPSSALCIASIVCAHAPLCRLAAHPALRVAPATVAFLTTAGDLDTDPAWFAVRPPNPFAMITRLLTRDSGAQRSWLAATASRLFRRSGLRRAASSRLCPRAAPAAAPSTWSAR